MAKKQICAVVNIIHYPSGYYRWEARLSTDGVPIAILKPTAEDDYTCLEREKAVEHCKHVIESLGIKVREEIK